MGESASVRRWKLAERLERKAQHPKVPPKVRARALKATERLKKVVVWSETKKLRAIVKKHRRQRSNSGGR